MLARYKTRRVVNPGERACALVPRKRDQLLSNHGPQHCWQLGDAGREQHALGQREPICASVELRANVVEQPIEIELGTLAQQELQVDEVSRPGPSEEVLHLVHGRVQERLDDEPSPPFATSDRIVRIEGEVDPPDFVVAAKQQQAVPRSHLLLVDSHAARTASAAPPPNTISAAIFERATMSSTSSCHGASSAGTGSERFVVARVFAIARDCFGFDSVLK
jgi:hypothetical protein